MERTAIDPMWDAPPRERLITMPRELPERTLGLVDDRQPAAAERAARG